MKVNIENLYDLIMFENRLQDDKANILTLSDGYLWRRDDAKLVAKKIDIEDENVYNYSINDFKLPNEEEIKEIEIQEAGVLHIYGTEGTIKTISSIETVYRPISIQVLKNDKFDWVIEVDTKQLTRELMSMYRKVNNQKSNAERESVILNLENLTLSLASSMEEKQIGINVKTKGTIDKIYYSFFLFRDLLISSKQFDTKVTFSILNDYFTIIEYNNSTFSVLNHKRKKES